MELSERYIQTLEKEGFATVYEWQDVAGHEYAASSQSGKVAYLVTDGSITISLANDSTTIVAGDRFDVPAGVAYQVTVGPDGWIGIIGSAD